MSSTPSSSPRAFDAALRPLFFCAVALLGVDLLMFLFVKAGALLIAAVFFGPLAALLAGALVGVGGAAVGWRAVGGHPLVGLGGLIVLVAFMALLTEPLAALFDLRSLERDLWLASSIAAGLGLALVAVGLARSQGRSAARAWPWAAITAAAALGAAAFTYGHVHLGTSADALYAFILARDIGLVGLAVVVGGALARAPRPARPRDPHPAATLAVVARGLRGYRDALTAQLAAHAAHALLLLATFALGDFEIFIVSELAALAIIAVADLLAVRALTDLRRAPAGSGVRGPATAALTLHLALFVAGAVAAVAALTAGPLDPFLRFDRPHPGVTLLGPAFVARAMLCAALGAAAVWLGRVDLRRGARLLIGCLLVVGLTFALVDFAMLGFGLTGVVVWALCALSANVFALVLLFRLVAGLRDALTDASVGPSASATTAEAP